MQAWNVFIAKHFQSASCIIIYVREHVKLLKLSHVKFSLYTANIMQTTFISTRSITSNTKKIVFFCRHCAILNWQADFFYLSTLLVSGVWCGLVWVVVIFRTQNILRPTVKVPYILVYMLHWVFCESKEVIRNYPKNWITLTFISSTRDHIAWKIYKDEVTMQWDNMISTKRITWAGVMGYGYGIQSYYYNKSQGIV